jgi:hypothetical protein
VWAANSRAARKVKGGRAVETLPALWVDVRKSFLRRD